MDDYLPILSQPVQLHSSRNPGNCTLTPEQCAFKNRYWVFWYNADLVYCLPVVYFFVSAIVLFTFGRLISDFAPVSVTKSKPWRRCVSGLRFLSYKSWRVGRWNTQSLGTFLLAGVGIVFFSALILGPKPYYWPTDAHYGNSPPLATRSGWAALACIPFILAFGTKANVVSKLTGIPPERLNIWHNWVSWAMLVLALIHTFPFIVYNNYKGDMATVFRTGGTYLTGVIALICEAWLTFMSIPWIRNKSYEFFKSTHYFFAAAFLVFFFLHCNFVLTSWNYFIAAGAIYFACLFYALVKTYIQHGISHRAQLRLQTPDSLRVSIPIKSNWKPGQHAYLRFVTGGFHIITAHPFTICSVPCKDRKDNEMVFYLKPRGGITRRLADEAKRKEDVSVRVLIDGPYGGMPARWSKGFDHTVLIAGGSGSAFTLALIEDWISRRNSYPTRELKVILATRDADMRTWYVEELQRIAERQCDVGLGEITGLSIEFYETCGTASEIPQKSHNSPSSSDEEEIGKEAKAKCYARSAVSLFGIKYFRGRPDTCAIVREISLQESRSTVGVAVCGPSGMVYDVASEAAVQQQRIVRGHAGAQEVWFHREAFSY